MTCCETNPLLEVHLAAAPLRYLAGKVPFDGQVPALGNTMTMQVPKFLAMAALDAGYRVANTGRRARAELTVGEVLGRLEREISSSSLFP